MSLKYEAKITEYTVKPVEEKTFSINATIIRVADDGGGEFLTFTQDGDDGIERTIAFEKEDWPVVVEIGTKMMAGLKGGE